MKDESMVAQIESFNQRCPAFILHPSSFILALVSPASAVADGG
jgi:hypothetical protein